MKVAKKPTMKESELVVQKLKHYMLKQNMKKNMVEKMFDITTKDATEETKEEMGSPRNENELL